MKKKIIEIIGWYGAVAIILAYGLNSFSFLNQTNLFYQLLNLTGGIGILTISFYKRTYQPGVLNIIWTIIALVAILKILFLH